MTIWDGRRSNTADTNGSARPRAKSRVLPRRHHEDVPRAPFQYLAVDRGRAPALGADEDGAVGRAVFLALEALREHREIRAHGRQHRTAVDRIGVTHARAVALVDIAGLHHAFHDRAGARVSVIDDRTAVRPRRSAVGQHAGTVEG